MPEAACPRVDVEEKILYQDGSTCPATELDPPLAQEGDDASERVKTMNSRAYQLEMLNESLQKNVIVSVSWTDRYAAPFFLSCLFLTANIAKMDTGSGKTKVYI